jgi:hypothetical protein
MVAEPNSPRRESAPSFDQPHAFDATRDPRVERARHERRARRVDVAVVRAMCVGEARRSNSDDAHDAHDARRVFADRRAAVELAVCLICSQ